jgi:hypothetical protein
LTPDASTGPLCPLTGSHPQMDVGESPPGTWISHGLIDGPWFTMNWLIYISFVVSEPLSEHLFASISSLFPAAPSLSKFDFLLFFVSFS